MSVVHGWTGSGQSAESPRFWSLQQPISLPEPESALGPSLASVRVFLCVVLDKDASSKSRGGDDNIPPLAFLFPC